MTHKIREASIPLNKRKATWDRQSPPVPIFQGACKDKILGQAYRIASHGLPEQGGCASSALCAGALCSLCELSCRELDRIAHTASYPEETALFVEGQLPRGVYVLCEGCVKLTTTNRDGKTFIVRIANRGEMLGLQSMVTGNPHDLTVQTLVRSQLAFVHRTDFLRFINHHPDAALQVARQVSAECQSAYGVIRSIGLSHSVSEKFARLLLQWCNGSSDSGGSVQVKVSLTQEEMAQLIGTTRETVTRTLSGLKKRGILEWSGGTLVIRDRAALEKIVGEPV